MEFIIPHLDAFLTFIITAISFIGVIYAKFYNVSSRIDKVELRIDSLEKNIKESNNKIDKVESNLVARLDRIENKIDNFIQKQV